MGANVLRIATTPESQCGESILAGELADMSLPAILHLLEIESFTGWLLIDDEFRIDLRRGHVTGASAGPKEGVEALKEVLVAGGARFEVLRGTPRQERALERVSSTLIDSFRILDEWARIEGLVLRLVGDQRWRPTGREIDVVMAEIDGKSALRDLVAPTGVSLCTVVDEILEAKRLGLVVEAAPVPSEEAADGAKRGHDLQESAPTTDDFAGLDLFDLRDRARAATKSGDYELAEAALQAALRLSPGDRIASQNLRRVRELRGR